MTPQQVKLKLMDWANHKRFMAQDDDYNEQMFWLRFGKEVNDILPNEYLTLEKTPFFLSIEAWERIRKELNEELKKQPPKLPE